MSTVGRNIVALYGANGLTALVGFLATPVYLHFLGIEAYGLTGILATLQGWFALLDMGLTPALSRSVTQFAAGTREATWLWSIVKGLERLYGGVATLATLLMIAAAPWAATSWLHTQQLAHYDVVASLALMGIIIGSRLWCGLYIGGVTGLQRLNWLSGFTAVTAVVRILASLAVLAWVSPSIVALMATQAVLGVWECLYLRAKFHSMMPSEGRDAVRNPTALRDIRGYSAGLAASTVVAVLLTGLDKIILSTLLTLEQFGYYMLAVTASSFLYRLIAPVYTAILPRLTHLAAIGDKDGFVIAYHRAAQLIPVMTVPVAMLLVVFPEQTLLAWTGKVETASEAAGPLRILAFATMLHGFMYVSYAAQLAHGWTDLALRISLVQCVVLVPVMIVGVMHYGVIAAAATWLALNLVNLAIGQVLMTRRILKGEMTRWYLNDILPVVAAVTFVAGLLHTVVPNEDSRLSALVFLSAAGTAMALAAIFATPLRKDAIAILRSMVKGSTTA